MAKASGIRQNQLASPPPLPPLPTAYEDRFVPSPPPPPPATEPLDHASAVAAVAALKRDLAKQNEATPIFGNSRGDGLEAFLGNIEQTMFGEQLHPSPEEKAAHLLYFVV